ncbi:MAG: serine hydrolase domain-containing protein [Saprospiraceae bacterium]
MKFIISILFISTASIFFYSNKELPNVVALDTQLSNIATSEKDKSELIQTIIDAYVTDHDVPALVVGLVENGAVNSILNKGILERGESASANGNSIFQIASLSKSFTGIIARSLEEEGLIDLHASIADYFPKNTSKNILEKLQPLTVKDLLVHHAGFPRDAKNLKRGMFGGPVIGTYTEEDLFDDLEKMQLEFEPRTNWSYSNLAFSCIGYLLERVSGMSYEALLKKYVAEKYGLENTVINLNEQQKREHLATAYRPEWNTISVRSSDFGKQTPASGIYSTVEDLTKLMIAQMKAYQNFETNDTPLILTREKIPMGIEGESPNYGFGFFEVMSNQDPKTLNLGHNGDFDGFASCYIFFPNLNVGLVMLTSSGGQWFWEMQERIQEVIIKS